MHKRFGQFRYRLLCLSMDLSEPDVSFPPITHTSFCEYSRPDGTRVSVVDTAADYCSVQLFAPAVPFISTSRREEQR